MPRHPCCCQCQTPLAHLYQFSGGTECKCYSSQTCAAPFSSLHLCQHLRILITIVLKQQSRTMPIISSTLVRQFYSIRCHMFVVVVSFQYQHATCHCSYDFGAETMLINVNLSIELSSSLVLPMTARLQRAVAKSIANCSANLVAAQASIAATNPSF